MSAFYDQASLVVVPSGYKSGKIYAQKPLTTDGQLTFTRASTATRVAASGLIETVSSGVPRLDYLGSTCPKILLEPQRTNIATQSNNYSGFNKGADTGVTLNSTTSPDGTSNATLVYCINTTTNGYIAQGFTGSSSTLYTVSFYAKKKELDLVYIKNVNDTGGQSYFNLTTGVATLLTGIDSVSMTAVGNGWYRCVAKSTSASTNVQWIPIIKGNANEGLYIYGLQIEVGAYETSLIPTSGSAVTRLADTYQKAGFGNTSTAGTLYYEFSNYNSPASANGQYMVILFAGSSVTSTDFSAANAISIINNGVAIEGRNNGYSTTLFSFTPTAGATVKVALRYDGTNVVAFVNGTKGTVFTDTSVGAKNALRVNNGENATHASKQLLFFPSALTDAQCIELTTL